MTQRAFHTCLSIMAFIALSCMFLIAGMAWTTVDRQSLNQSQSWIAPVSDRHIVPWIIQEGK